MSKCPNCGESLVLNSPAEYNATYGSESVIAKALCCGKGVILKPVRSMSIHTYAGDHKTDSWGHALDGIPIIVSSFAKYRAVVEGFLGWPLADGGILIDILRDCYDAGVSPVEAEREIKESA